MEGCEGLLVEEHLCEQGQGTYWQRGRGLWTRALFPVSLPGIFTIHFLHEKGKHARKIQTHIEDPLLTQATHTHIHTSIEAHTSGGKSQDSRVGPLPAWSPK